MTDRPYRRFMALAAGAVPDRDRRTRSQIACWYALPLGVRRRCAHLRAVDDAIFQVDPEHGFPFRGMRHP